MDWKKTLVFTVTCCLVAAPGPRASGDDEDTPDRTVRGKVQMRPGGELEDAEMGVYEAPVDPKSVRAKKSDLADDDLVLGVVADGVAMAYPIRYVAMYEVVDDRVGGTALAPTW